MTNKLTENEMTSVSLLEEKLKTWSDLCVIFKHDHEDSQASNKELFEELQKVCEKMNDSYKDCQTRLDATLKYRLTQHSDAVTKLEHNIEEHLMASSTEALEQHIGRVQNAADDAVRTLNAFKKISIKNIAYTILATVAINVVVTTSLVYTLSPQKIAKTNEPAHQYYKGMEIVDH